MQAIVTNLFNKNIVPSCLECQYSNSTDLCGPSVVVNSIVEDGIKIGKDSVVSHCYLKVNQYISVSLVLYYILARKKVPGNMFRRLSLCYP